MANVDDILKTALCLGLRDRARLAERLLASLDSLTEAETEQLWLDEAETRLSEYRAGRAKTVPADEVAQRAQRLFR